MRTTMGLFSQPAAVFLLPLRRATFEIFLSLEEKSDDLIRRTNMKDKNITVNSPNFFECLALLFIGLRVAGVTTMPWLWVLSPLWLPASLALLIACVVVLCGH